MQQGGGIVVINVIMGEAEALWQFRYLLIASLIFSKFKPLDTGSTYGFRLSQKKITIIKKKNTTFSDP